MIKNAASMQVSGSLIDNNDKDENSQSKDDGEKVPSQQVAVKDDVLENVFIGKIPVMVMSNICYLADMQMEERKRVGQWWRLFHYKWFRKGSILLCVHDF